MTMEDGHLGVEITERQIFLEVPKRRGHRDKMIAAVMSICSGVLLLWRIPPVESVFDVLTTIESFFCVIELLSTVVFSQLVAELLRRFCLFCEEILHLRTRYDGIMKKVLWATLQLDWTFATYLVTSTVLIVLCALWNWTNGRLVLRYDFIGYFYVVIQLVWHVVGYKVPSKPVNEMNFGKAFAWQYYYGYLDIILPGLASRMQSYEEEHGLKLAAHRLFLLVPESCYLQPTLDRQQADLNVIERCQEMELVTKNHCGSSGRVYKNHVYNIWKNGHNPVYVVMEGIAILTNLYGMNLDITRTGLTDEMLREQTRLFLRALQDILNSKLVEIVFYKDEDERGSQVKISDVILEKLKELKNYN